MDTDQKKLAIQFEIELNGSTETFSVGWDGSLNKSDGWTDVHTERAMEALSGYSIDQVRAFRNGDAEGVKSRVFLWASYSDQPKVPIPTSLSAYINAVNDLAGKE